MLPAGHLPRSKLFHQYELIPTPQAYNHLQTYPSIHTTILPCYLHIYYHTIILSYDHNFVNLSPRPLFTVLICLSGYLYCARQAQSGDKRGKGKGKHGNLKTKANSSADDTGSSGNDIVMMAVRNAETRLLVECGDNYSWQALLCMAIIDFLQEEDIVQQYLDQCVTHICAAEDEEVKLLQLLEREKAKDFTFEKRAAAIAKRKSKGLPVADLSIVELSEPRVIGRSATTITLQVTELSSAIRMKASGAPAQNQHFRVFGKLAGVGTAVSLTNNNLTGCGLPIHVESGKHVLKKKKKNTFTFMFARP